MSMLKYNSDFVICLFCTIDDICKQIIPFKDKSKGGRPNNLTISELITISILFLNSGCDAFSKFYLFANLQEYFNLNSYPRLLHNLKSSLIWQLLILVLICHKNRQVGDEIKFIDSMPIKVCKNKRIFTYKVSNLADRGKSSIGWFYGFKVHLVVDKNGKLLNFKITTGNISDKNQELLRALTKNLKGLLIGDKGYQSKEMFSEFKNRGLYFLTGLRKSKRQNTSLVFQGYHQLKKLRQKIETINGQVKYRQGMESSLPRSNGGYFWRYTSAILSFCILSQFMGFGI